MCEESVEVCQLRDEVFEGGLGGNGEKGLKVNLNFRETISFGGLMVFD